MGIDGKAEHTLMSGDSEIRLIAEDDSLFVTYLTTTVSGVSHVSEKSGYTMPTQFRNTECVEYLKGALSDFFTENNITTWRSDFESISYISDKENRHFANGLDVMVSVYCRLLRSCGSY